MKKIKYKTLLLTIIMVFTFGLSIVFADEFLDDATIEVNKNNLPTEFLVDSEEEVDFLKFFVVRDNGEEMNLYNLEEGDQYFLIENFDISLPGTYNIKILYFGKNDVSVDATIVLTVIEVDNKAPEFEKDANGNPLVKDIYEVDVKRENRFANFYSNFRAYDNIDGPLRFESNADIEGLSDIDINTLGEYEITIIFEDSSGNVLSKKVTVKVVDKDAPLVLYKRVYHTKKGKDVNFLDDIKIEDNYDAYEDLDISFVYEYDDKEYSKTEFDSSKIGEHKITITVVDQSGNSQVETFRIVVENGLGLFNIVLIINASLLGVAFITLGLMYILRKNNKKDIDHEEQ